MAGHPGLRGLPSVDRILVALASRGVLDAFPRRAATLCVREVLDEARQRIRRGGEAPVGDERIADEAEALLRRRFGGTLRRAVNATGIILHTNLGRAPLSAAARAAVADMASGYSTLELDLQTGQRGSRQAHLEALLRAVTGAEAGLAVNNAAAAVTLTLAALAGGRQVAVSRGELIEIGGSFRLPEVMDQSGARLMEVGTTNRTYPADYEAALDRGAALLLKVHRSNFTQSGFVHDVELTDLVALGRRRGVPVVYDLGSGCLVDLSAAGLPREPTVQASVAAGADLVLFSGDKLLGGPQAGVVVGMRAAVERCRRHPLARAFRIDKLDLAALAATLAVYLDPDRAWREIPILAMLSLTPAQRRRRALRLARRVGRVLGGTATASVVQTVGEIGGGSLPGAAVPSWAVAIRPADGRPDAWAARLRAGAVPVVGVVRDDALLLDVLALLPGDDRLLPGLLRSAAGLG
ncbi:MAG: L-seryl-tRNA(Sec) selenium transferase [Armatimonadota bacterium]|nr:L-seryl-tRNA(Sec) selenium transferase [Armatimonadota bacterium]